MNINRKFYLSLAILSAFAVPVIALAQGATALPNPLGEGVNNPQVIIGNIIRAILGITGSLALAVFIYGGFSWVTSAGNEEKVKKGKDMMFWASVGLAVIFFSYALVTFVITAVTGQSSSGSTQGGGSNPTTGGGGNATTGGGLKP